MKLRTTAMRATLACLLIGLGCAAVPARADDWKDETRHYWKEIRKREKERIKVLRKRDRELRELARERERDRRRAVREWQEFQRDYWRRQERIARDRARALDRWREVESYRPAPVHEFPLPPPPSSYYGPYDAPPYGGEYYEPLPPPGM